MADVDCEEEMIDKVSCGANARGGVRAVWEYGGPEEEAPKWE